MSESSGGDASSGESGQGDGALKRWLQRINGYAARRATERGAAPEAANDREPGEVYDRCLSPRAPDPEMEAWFSAGPVNDRYEVVREYERRGSDEEVAAGRLAGRRLAPDATPGEASSPREHAASANEEPARPGEAADPVYQRWLRNNNAYVERQRAKEVTPPQPTNDPEFERKLDGMQAAADERWKEQFGEEAVRRPEFRSAERRILMKNMNERDRARDLTDLWGTEVRREQMRAGSKEPNQGRGASTAREPEEGVDIGS